MVREGEEKEADKKNVCDRRFFPSFLRPSPLFFTPLNDSSSYLDARQQLVVVAKVDQDLFFLECERQGA